MTHFRRDGGVFQQTLKEAELFQQIGKLQMELEWLKKSLSCSDARELRKLVDHDHPELSVSRQCELLGLPRSTLYYRPTPVRASTLRIMARIDALYLEDPCSGSRRMVDYPPPSGKLSPVLLTTRGLEEIDQCGVTARLSKLTSGSG